MITLEIRLCDGSIGTLSMAMATLDDAIRWARASGLKLLVDEAREEGVNPTACQICGRAPSMRLGYLADRVADCRDPIHDLADLLVADLFAEADALGIPRDAATVREAVRAAQRERSARP